MRNINANGMTWAVEIEDVEGDLLVTATSGKKVFCDWIDRDNIRITTVDHANGCGNLTEEDEDTVRAAINDELKYLAEKMGYTAGYNNYGYDGTLEDASGDEEIQEALEKLF